MKCVTLYRSAPGARDRIAEVYPRHVEWIGPFRERGDVLLIGPFADPAQGAMGVFVSREAAEAFVAGDPFVTEGLVADVEYRDWMVD